MCTQQEAIGILREVVEKSSAVLPVQDAFLYGSYARGDFGEDSDVDIFLTTPLSRQEAEKKRWEISGVASDISLAHDVVVSICVRNAQDFQPEHNPYHCNVFREGIRYPAGGALS